MYGGLYSIPSTAKRKGPPEALVRGRVFMSQAGPTTGISARISVPIQWLECHVEKSVVMEARALIPRPPLPGEVFLTLQLLLQPLQSIAVPQKVLINC